MQKYTTVSQNIGLLRQYFCSLKLFQRYLFIGFVASFSALCLVFRFIDKVLWLQKVIIKVTERLMAPFMIDLIDLRADRSQPSWLSWSILDLSVLALLISSVVAICKIGRGQTLENFCASTIVTPLDDTRKFNKRLKKIIEYIVFICRLL